MKIDHDCVRDILIWLEENQRMESSYGGSLTGRTNYIMSTEIAHSITGHQKEDIFYSIKQMIDCGLLNAISMGADGAGWYRIVDITPYGHEFLGNIRNPENWTKAKSFATKIGAVTIDALCKIAGSMIAELIKSRM